MELQKNIIITGDALTVLKRLPSESVNMCVTSPPYYGLRDYGVAGQIGLEQTPEQYLERLVEVFREVRRILRPDGTLWLNLGDSYAGGAGRWGGDKNISSFQAASKGSLGQIGKMKKWEHATIKPKDLIGIPWAAAFALRGDGWYLRQDIIWAKTNPMPESVTDRCTKSHEYVFLLSKSKKYYFDAAGIKEPCTANSIADFKRRKNMDKRKGGLGTYWEVRPDLFRPRNEYIPKDFMRNKRDVWTLPTNSFVGAHFATYPIKLIEPCIVAGCPSGGIVLDPFFGSGTTGITALKNLRNYIGIELNPDYVKIAQNRIDEFNSSVG